MRFQYATEGLGGHGLEPTEPIVTSMERLIPTGIYIALPMGYEAQVRPRSGLALKHGISVCNTPGTVDVIIVMRLVSSLSILVKKIS